MDLKELKRNGFILIKDYFDKRYIDSVLRESKNVFLYQIKRLGICEASATIEDPSFNRYMFKLFEMDFEAFANCGKQVQHLISLHRLSLNEKVIESLKSLGMGFPNISTRPVMYFNHPNLAKEEVYYKVFPHQDWRSMQGSLDSIVLWLPLLDIDINLGALEVIPGSHKWGLITDSVEYGFGKVALTEEQQSDFVSVEVKVGDALFFSSFLVHQSGNNVTDEIRWSAHFRYNNLEEPSFINRKYAHPYIYRPQEELITTKFPRLKNIKDLFGE